MSFRISTWALLFCTTLAQIEASPSESSPTSFERWLSTHNPVVIKRKRGQLSLSGDVRTEIQGAIPTKKQNDKVDILWGIDIEANLLINYRTDCSWSSIKLRFDSDAGIFLPSNSQLRVQLDRAYWGLRVAEQTHQTLDLECGRRGLSSLFDSKVQFGTVADGVSIRHNYFSTHWDVQNTAAFFVVQDQTLSLSFAAETAWLNLGGTSFYSKWSCIAWNLPPLYPTSALKKKQDFFIVQTTGGYQFRSICLEKPTHFYAGYACNLLQREPRNLFPHPYAAYIGVSIGSLFNKGDWALDFNLQKSTQNAIPLIDLTGLTIYTPQANLDSFSGFALFFSYMLTSQLNVQQVFSYVKGTSFSKDTPKLSQWQYELEFIYSW